ENYDEFGPRFKDMTEVYSKTAGNVARKVAAENGIEITDGVYAYFPGPMYESPAEILAYRALGADAVGMSTVPEAIAARHGGQTTLGISLITNRAAGLGNAELSHAEVVEIANKAEKNLVTLVKGVITQW
ncbi:MAG: purine-nucleoside phosphorylase, partial [Lachnospiraceae bacterium]|nr:purine-nucleoside phosphorylase [Lachnospiraceae bacterium]